MTTPATAPVPGSTSPITPPAPGEPGSPVLPPTGTPAAPPTPPVDPAAGTPAPPAPAADPLTLDVSGDEGEKKGTFTYRETGDKKLDMALAFVGKHGFGPDHPGIVAAQNGDFSILRAELSEKNVAGAEAYLQLAEASYEVLHAKHEAQRAADKEALFKAVGGEDNWQAVTAWAKENATPDEQSEVNSMLAKGGVAMRIAAGFLASQYNAATGGLPEGEGSGPPVAEHRGAPAPASGALSPQEYGRAVADAQKNHKGREPFEQSKEYQSLRERRLRFKG